MKLLSYKQVLTTVLALLLVVPVVFGFSLTLTGCGEPKPPEVTDEAAAEDAAADEGSGEEEGDGTDAHAKPAHKKPHAPPPYSKLSLLPFEAFEVPSQDGLRLSGRLYDPYQVGVDKEAKAHAKPTDEATHEEGPAVGALADEGEGDGEEAVAPVKPKPKTFYPLVILIHGFNSYGKNWDSVAVELVQQGYAVLLLELRGHGESARVGKTQFKSWRVMSFEDWHLINDDMKRVLRFFKTDGAKPLQKRQYPQLKPGQLALVGVGLGANASLVASGTYPNQVAVVGALAPGLNYKGIEPAVPMLDYSGPTWFAASEADSYSFESTQKLYAVAQGPKAINLYKDIGTGMDMLFFHPPLRGQLYAWLNQYFPPVAPPAGLFPAPAQSVHAQPAQAQHGDAHPDSAHPAAHSPSHAGEEATSGHHPLVLPPSLHQGPHNKPSHHAPASHIPAAHSAPHAVAHKTSTHAVVHAPAAHAKPHAAVHAPVAHAKPHAAAVHTPAAHAKPHAAVHAPAAHAKPHAAAVHAPTAHAKPHAAAVHAPAAHTPAPAALPQSHEPAEHAPAEAPAQH